MQTDFKRKMRTYSLKRFNKYQSKHFQEAVAEMCEEILFELNFCSITPRNFKLTVKLADGLSIFPKFS